MPDQPASQPSVEIDIKSDIFAWIQHNIVRTIGVVVVLTVLVGLPFIVWMNGHAEGYRKGYAQALTDHPQQIYNAPATVNNNPPKSSAIYGLKLGRAWGIGVCHE